MCVAGRCSNAAFYYFPLTLRRDGPYLVFNVQRAFVLMEKFQGVYVAMPRGPVDGIGSTLYKTNVQSHFQRADGSECVPLRHALVPFLCNGTLPRSNFHEE